MRKKNIPLGLYGITAENFANGKSNIECVKQMIKGGIKIIQYREKYSLDLPLKLMFFIPAIIEVSHGSEILIVDAYIFQALVPLVYLEEDDVINTQWTIFRKLN